MKKKIFAVALAAVMTITSAVSAFAEDVDCTGWWTAHSTGFEVTAEGIEITCTSKTYADAKENWNTPIYVLYGGDEAKVNGAGYTEYFVCRSDAYGWTPAGNTANSILGDGWTATPAEDWAAWLDANKAGVTVTVKAKLEGSNAVVTIENNGVVSTATVPVDTSKKIYVSLSGELCKLTDVKLAGEAEAPTEPPKEEGTTKAPAADTTTKAPAADTTTKAPAADAPATGDATATAAMVVVAFAAAAAVVVLKKKAVNE